MAAGDLTVTLEGTYATLALAVAKADTLNLPAATDKCEIIVIPGGISGVNFAVVKTVREA